MALVKCPRCELNYMNEGEKMCSVCRKELHGESEQYDVIELCSECGENPVVPGQELCASCLKEFARRNSDTSEDGVGDSSMSLDAMDAVSSMKGRYLRSSTSRMSSGRMPLASMRAR